MHFNHSPYFPAVLATTLALVTCAPAPETVPSSTSRGLEEVSYQHVHLTGGFWGPRLRIHHQTTIPHVLDKLEEHQHMQNFDVAARVLQGEQSAQAGSGNDTAGGEALKGDPGAAKSYSGPGSAENDDGIVGHSAFDSDVYKALEGACLVLGYTHDPFLRQRVDSILDRILAAQEGDGYLVSYFTAKAAENKWANMRANHELYNAGHFFEFAVAHHQVTGETRALEAARRFADHIDQTFGPGKRYQTSGHQEIELALIKLYRATGEARYLELCRFLLDERGHAHGTERQPFNEVIPRGDPPRKPGQSIREWRQMKWSLRNGRQQDHKPILEENEAVGHAVRAGYMYAAMADLARFTEAPDYAKHVRLLWEDVVYRKMYLTGGLGTAQYGDEGFGDPYLLPNKTYCESCANIANVLWQNRMNLLDGQARYADVMELALYNSAIAGMTLAGDAFFYQNPLESPKGQDRRSWIGLACCPTNHARLTPQISGFVYAKTKGTLYLNLYAAGTASIELGRGTLLKLTQETDYPWDGKVRLHIDPPSPALVDLRLRIPGWAINQPVPGDLYRFATNDPNPVTLTLNGEPLKMSRGEDGYVSINRIWKSGDVLELNLPMPVRRVYSHENLTENRGKVAIMRGPLVYCLEGIDNPGLDLFKVKLPEKSELRAEHHSALLNGVTIINGKCINEQGTPTPFTAIPYFAWANRDKSPMRIWLPQAEDSH
jgi:DUF1680 family protein